MEEQLGPSVFRVLRLKRFLLSSSSCHHQQRLCWSLVCGLRLTKTRVEFFRHLFFLYAPTLLVCFTTPHTLCKRGCSSLATRSPFATAFIHHAASRNEAHSSLPASAEPGSSTRSWPVHHLSCLLSTCSPTCNKCGSSRLRDGGARLLQPV